MRLTMKYDYTGCTRWRAALAAVAAALLAASASALDVVYDDRTPAECREWGERFFVREQMEVLASKICKALYG